MSDVKDTQQKKKEKLRDQVDLAKEALEVHKDFEKSFVPFGVSFKTATNFKRSPLRKIVDSPVCYVKYPDTLTDQTHALTLAQQVRRGQGDAEKPDPSQFDFPDGKDDGSVAHGLFEFSNRVDQWIAEQGLADELRESFRSQVLNNLRIQSEKSKIQSSEKVSDEKVSDEQVSDSK